MSLFGRSHPSPYPEEPEDRRAGRRTAKTWLPHDPRDPDPPQAVKLICAEVLTVVLDDYRSHQRTLAALEEALVDARQRLAAAEDPGVVDPLGRPGPPDRPAAIDSGTGDGADDEFLDFDLAQDERLRREADAEHRRRVADARRSVELVEARWRRAEIEYRLIFAERAAKGARRIRTVTDEVLARHPLRAQLVTLDQRCLDALQTTIQQLAGLSPPDLTDGLARPAGAKE